MTMEVANSAFVSSGNPPLDAPRFLSRLHLSVVGAGDRTVLLDPRTSIRQLVTGLGGGRSQGLAVERTGEVLALGAVVGYTDLRSGDRVEFSTVSASIRQTYIIRFLTGSRAGERLVLPIGETRIGRAADNDVTIVDAAMSRHHAVLAVDGDTVMLADAGSTNGVMIGERMVTAPTPLEPGQRALVGQSWFEILVGDRTVEPDPQPLGPLGSGNRIELTVIEHPVEPYVGDYIEFPEPPERSRLPRLRGGRETFDDDVSAFEQAMESIETRITEAREAELAGRLAEAPPVSKVIRAVVDDVANCWGSLVANGVTARIGLATRPTRTHMLIPAGGDPELREKLTRLAHGHELIEGVPAVVRFDRVSSVVIEGPGPDAAALSRSLVAQVAGRHRASELRIWAMVDQSRVGSWDWLKWLPHCGGPTVDAMAQLATTGDDFARLIGDLESLADPARFNLLVVDADLPDSVAGALSELGDRLPVSVLVVAGYDRSERQRALRIGDEVSTIELEGDSASMSEPLVVGIGYETASMDEVRRLARALSPVVESDQLASSLAPVPSGCDDGAGLTSVLRGNDPAIVAENWDISSTNENTLVAVIGHDDSEPVELALDDGPHALVSGQYECFLPAWLTTLAAGHSPHRFNFFLFDSQNGLVFRECRSLPHCVGVVDDMRTVALKSALAALSAELDRRDAVLSSVGMESVHELERNSRPGGFGRLNGSYVLPRLLVVVDQLSELDRASCLDPLAELIELSERGRRLGLHLVLGVGSELIHESDVVVLGSAPANVADLDAVIIHLPRRGTGLLRISGSEPRLFAANVAGQRPEIVVHDFRLGHMERLHRGPVKIAYQDDLARLVTQVTKAYDYSGGVRPSWLI